MKCILIVGNQNANKIVTTWKIFRIGKNVVAQQIANLDVIVVQVISETTMENAYLIKNAVYFCLSIFSITVSIRWVKSLFLASTPKCNDPHEIYSPCGNNSCQNMCENRNIKGNCIGPCIPGCICGQGYFRNEKGKCVSYYECGKY